MKPIVQNLLHFISPYVKHENISLYHTSVATQLKKLVFIERVVTATIAPLVLLGLVPVATNSIRILALDAKKNQEQPIHSTAR